MEATVVRTACNLTTTVVVVDGLVERRAVVIVASGQCSLQVRQPDVDRLGVEVTAAVLDSDVDAHRDHEPVVGEQLIPAVPGDTVGEELIVVSPEERLFKSSPVGDGPIENGHIDQVVDAEPGGQAPVEGLPREEGAPLWPPGRSR